MKKLSWVVIMATENAFNEVEETVIATFISRAWAVLFLQQCNANKITSDVTFYIVEK